jgi:hypothetical protein
MLSLTRFTFLALILLPPGWASAQEDPPAAAWTFQGSVRQKVLDVSGHAHHAVEQAPGTFVPAPGGKARVFDGSDAFLWVTDHPDLQAADRLTIDAWVRLDELKRAETQCLVDKTTDRYRLQITGDRPVFALKCPTARVDVGGGRLTAGRWHRITGVFQRPHVALYLDGKQVAQQDWDHAIDPGGDLVIGAHAGSESFLKGQFDELRIYRRARPPLATDAPSTASHLPGVAAAPAKLEMSEVAGGVAVDTGAMRLELTDDCAVRTLALGKKLLVTGNRAPLVAAEVFESHAYDGRTDSVPGRTIPAVWHAESHAYERGAREFHARYVGRLDFGAGDAIACRLALSAAAGSPFLVASAELEARGTFENRFLRSVALRLPLALDKRKRIVQAGDRGVQWNTRHWYQFHVAPTGTLLPEPDHNIWRLFAVDQNTSGDYHLWRSESEATSPLTMQRGLEAAGWMAAYDRQGGLLFAYRGMAGRAPKSLRVMADGGGEAAVYLWHAGLPALDVRSPQASAVFGRAHVSDWMVFAEDPAESLPDVALAQHWGVTRLASDPPARNELPLADLSLEHSLNADADAPLVSGGVPLAKGALRDPAKVRLRRGEADVPVQTRPLAYWPDRSIKWLLLTFPANGGAVVGASGEGASLPLRLARRDGAPTAYRLDYGGTARTGTPQIALTARQQSGGVLIDTGPLRLELATGQRWLRSVKCAGREVLAGGVGSFVDFLRPESTYPCATSHAQGARDDGPLVVGKIELEEAGPLRAVVRLEGMTTAREPSRVIVRVEAFAGRSAVRVFHTVEFLHKDPRAAFVRRMGIELPLADVAGARVTVGGQDGPLGLGPGHRAGVRQHSHLGYQAWHQQPGERFLRVDETKHRCRGWLDVSGPQGGVAVVLRDMWQQFPNELLADLGERRVLACFWPESLPLMDMRRYSNYPHLAQGETVRPDSRWVADRYYGHEPVVGISKTHELLLYFHGPADAAKVDALAADFHRPPLVQADPDWYVQSGVVLPQSLPSSDKFPRTHANLDHYARFWMHQQKLWGWYGFWDYGDVQHNYKTGYGSIVPADKLKGLLQDASGNLAKSDVSKCRVQDYAPQNEWAFDNGRWGWNNTEGLPGMYMQNQYLRTGDRDMFFFAEAMARHFRDVDMRHDGTLFGLGTRHGVQHWSDGDHEERQTTHSEFRYIHCLTGDPRSRDFARQLFERVYSQRNVSRHAAHSGRLQGLLTWWELTGSDAVGRLLAEYVPFFLVEQGICESPRVRFQPLGCHGQNEDVNSGNMFFWTFGAGHGLLEYYYLTGDERLRHALLRVADHAMRVPDPGNFRKAVIFAARHADDPTPYRRYLDAWARTADIMLQVVPHNALVYGGPHGMLRGSVSGSLFALNDEAYLLSALNADPALTARRWEAIRRVDREGGPGAPPPSLDWQSDYDRPEFQEYLRIKHPQP